MAISRELSERIKDLLKDHPEGLSITNIVQNIPVNRNTASRYLDTLLVSGQVEMRHFGMAKIYTLSQRLPIAAVLSISSEYILQVDHNNRIIFINTPFLELLGLEEKDLSGKKMDYTPVPEFFGDEYVRLLRWITEALSGLERRGEIHITEKEERSLACRITPAVFTEGQKGVSIIFEDITDQRRDEELLKESEEKFRTLVEASSDGILVSDRQGNVMVWNQALSRITGIPQEEAIGVPLPEIMVRCLVPERRDQKTIKSITLQMKTAIRTGTHNSFFVPFEVEILRPDGERRVIQQTHFPIETSRGALVGSVIHDITERRHMLEEIKSREELFRTLFDNTADMITVHGFGPDGLPGTYIEVNDVACRRLGYTRDELLCMSPCELIDPAYLPVMEENAAKLRTEGNALFEIVHRAKDGRRIPVEVRSSLFEYKGTTLVLAQVRDLSRKKLVEAALEKTESRLKSIIRAAPVGIGLVVNRVITEVNTRLCEMTGYSAEELIGESARLLYPSDEEFDRVGTEKYAQILKEGSGSIETRWVRKDGGTRDILLSSTPLDAGNLADGVIFTALDITRRKQSEQAVRSSEERYRQLIERSFNAVVVIRDGTIVIANEVASEIAGLGGPEVMIGRQISSFFEPEVWESAGTSIMESLSVPDRATPLMRQHFVRPDGTPVEIEVMAINYLDDGVPAALVIFREITGIVSREESLKRSEAQYRMLAESATDMIYITDCNGNLVYANALCARIFGCTPADLIGKRQNDLFPEDIAARHIGLIRRVVSTGEAQGHVESVPTPAGIIRIDIRLSPILSPDGSVVSVVGIARDLSGKGEPGKD